MQQQETKETPDYLEVNGIRYIHYDKAHEMIMRFVAKLINEGRVVIADAIDKDDGGDYFKTIRQYINTNDLVDYKIGDKIVSKSPITKEKEGEVYKIYEYGISVKFTDGIFQVFHFNPTHHMQTPISQLSKSIAQPKDIPTTICLNCGESEPSGLNSQGFCDKCAQRKNRMMQD